MRVISPRHRWLVPLLLLLGLVGLTGCPDVGRDTVEDYSYESQPILIYNGIWGVIPLPNDLLNPVKMYSLPGFAIPGVEPPAALPTTVALPVNDQNAVDKINLLGWPSLQADSALTQSLIKGMNEIDGFIGGFIPNIPFTQPIDLASLVVYDGTNAEAANFFLLDITEVKEDLSGAAEKTTNVDPATYCRYFDLDGKTADESASYPYKFVMRNLPPKLESPATELLSDSTKAFPKDYLPGHTYLVVLTGVLDSGIKTLDGKPINPDANFLLMASESPWIAPDGRPLCNLLTTFDEKGNTVVDLPAVQQLEGARQVTDYGLKVWTAVTERKRSRSEVVGSFFFTISSHPVATFFNNAGAIGMGNAIQPVPADQYVWSDTEQTGVLDKPADAKCDASPSFVVSEEPDTATLADNILMYRLETTGETTAYHPVEIEPTACFSKKVNCEEKNICTDDMEDTSACRWVVTLMPKEVYLPTTAYMVAVRKGLLGKNGKPVADQSQFGLVRQSVSLFLPNESAPELPLLGSPFIDNRLDAALAWDSEKLMTDKTYTGPTCELTEEKMVKATETLYTVLKLIEGVRLAYAPHLTWLFANTDFVTGYEKLILFWTFTSSDKECAE